MIESAKGERLDVIGTRERDHVACEAHIAVVCHDERPSLPEHLASLQSLVAPIKLPAFPLVACAPSLDAIVAGSGAHPLDVTDMSVTDKGQIVLVI